MPSQEMIIYIIIAARMTRPSIWPASGLLRADFSRAVTQTVERQYASGQTQGGGLFLLYDVCVNVCTLQTIVSAAETNLVLMALQSDIHLEESPQKVFGREGGAFKKTKQER